MNRSPKFVTHIARAEGDERQAEPVHRGEELAVQLEAELLVPVREQDQVDHERAAEVADDDPERPLLVDDDEDHGERHGDRDIRERRDRESDRTLLDPEQVRHLEVVDVHPEQDARCDDEARAAAVEVRSRAVVDVEPAGDLVREHDAEGERRASPWPSATRRSSGSACAGTRDPSSRSRTAGSRSRRPSAESRPRRPSPTSGSRSVRSRRPRRGSCRAAA